MPTAMSMNLDIAKRRDRWMNEEEGLAYIEAQMVAANELGFPIGKSAIESTPGFVEGLARIAERLDMTFGVEIHSPDSVDSPHVDGAARAVRRRRLATARVHPRLQLVDARRAARASSRRIAPRGCRRS